MTRHNPWSGLRIIESPHLVDGPFEDWSQVRSPSRAARRRKKQPQRIRIFYKPSEQCIHLVEQNAVVMHPAQAAALRALAQKEPNNG